MKRTAGKLAVLMLAVGMLLSGCGNEPTEADEKETMFISVESGFTWNVYYHRDTKVMYIKIVSAGGGVDWEVLVNPGGTPMIWEEKEE